MLGVVDAYHEGGKKKKKKETKTKIIMNILIFEK